MKLRVLRNVKWGEEGDIQRAGTVLDLPDAEAAEALRMPGVFESVEAAAEQQAREAERAAAEAPKRLMTHMELREQLRADEADRKAGEARILKQAAEHHGKISAEAERQAAVSAGQVDRAALSVVQSERAASAPVQPAPAQQDLPPHKRRRE